MLSRVACYRTCAHADAVQPQPAGALGGRIDHTLSNLNCLFVNEALDLVLLGDGNLCRAVPSGRTIVVPAPGVEGPACGLLPLLGPALATTTGLRWNLGASCGNALDAGNDPMAQPCSWLIACSVTLWTTWCGFQLCILAQQRWADGRCRCASSAREVLLHVRAPCGYMISDIATIHPGNAGVQTARCVWRLAAS